MQQSTLSCRRRAKRVGRSGPDPARWELRLADHGRARLLQPTLGMQYDRAANADRILRPWSGLLRHRRIRLPRYGVAEFDRPVPLCGILQWATVGAQGNQPPELCDADTH